MGYKVSVDVGGTFTDFLIADETGDFQIHKTPSVPKDPSKGVLNGLNEIASDRGVAIAEFLKQVDIIVHGTTITTNAVITGDYAKTGFLTTKGFRDYLNERRGQKPHVTYVNKTSPPKPIVPRHLIQTVEESIDADGNEITPLSKDDVLAAAKVFKSEGIEAIAISFLFSFLNPSHERQAKEILEKELPGAYICLSSDVLPQLRIYERGSTVVFNAAVAPLLRKHLENLVSRLKENSFNGTLLLMQSNGGVMAPEVAMDFAVNTLLSGPAGGPKAGLYCGETHDINNIITVDMGGTSFDACLIRDGNPEITIENEVAGYRMAMPSLEIQAIGAGGGSIAYIDRGGILRVGPQSAGADPGAACYGRGGEEPTVTDAALVLGYLNPDYFLGGKMKVYPDKAEKAVEKVAKSLGLDLQNTADGIFTIVNANMARGVRMSSVEKGYDPRQCMLVIAGGAGPIHCCDIAKELEMPLMLIPKSSSVFCASGMLVSNLRHDFVRVCFLPLKENAIDGMNSRYKEMREIGLATLSKENISSERMKFSYSCDLRYQGQYHEIEIPTPMSNDVFTLEKLPELLNAFDQKHDMLYGYNMAGTPVELICVRVIAEGVVDKIHFKEMSFLGEDASSAVKDNRKIYYHKNYLTVPIYDGSKVGHGHKIKGPAIIEEATTTIFVTPDYEMTADRYSNYLLYPMGEDIKAIISSLKK
jgi:N-methylhydantoinase A